MNNNDSGNPFEGILEESEQILWQGRPDVKMSLKWRMRTINIREGIKCLLSVLAFAVVYLINPSALRILCWLFGAYVVISVLEQILHPICIKRLAKDTSYALTNNRIMQCRNGHLIMRGISSLPEPSLKIRVEKTGAGSILFGEHSNKKLRQDRILFDTIPEARKVYDMIVDLRDKAQAG